MGSPHTYNHRFADAAGNILADPGASGTIKTDTRFSSHCQIVTAAAESRALADPAFVGQQLTLSMKTDGGDATVTADSAINSSGDTICTFAAIGELLKLESVEDGDDNLEWRVIVADGCTLS